MLKQATVTQSLGWTAVAVIVPAALRYAVDQGQGGIPFVTFFPPVLLVAVFLGWKYGALTAVASAILANRLFRPEPVLLFYVSVEDALLVALFLASCAIIIDVGGMLHRLIREQEAAKEIEAQVNQELLHRIKNMLTVVQSLAYLSARHTDPTTFSEAFNGRLGALGKANELLRIGRHASCSIGELVTAVTSPFRDEENFEITGPDCALPQDACVPLALGLHELCTNAAKYGALGVPGGRVTLAWSREADRDGALVVRWKESGGPKVQPKSRSGMGSRLLRTQPGLRDLQLRFEPDGVECEIVIAPEGA